MDAPAHALVVGVPFFALFPLLPGLLSGWMLVPVATTCCAAYADMRDQLAAMRLTWQEIIKVARYFELVPLRFPGFRKSDMLRLCAIQKLRDGARKAAAQAIYSAHSAPVQVPGGSCPRHASLME